MSRALAIAVAALIFGLAPRAAFAHDFRPGVLSLVEVAPGELEVSWVEPVDANGAPAGVQIVAPAQCQVSPSRWSCGEQGLSGEIRFEGVRLHRVRIVVVISWRERASEEHIVSGESPVLSLQARPSGFSSWLGLGVVHVLGGLDHLGFVIGLLLIVPFSRALLWTITAFTLAHSLTLCLSALDLFTLPRAPVEAAIAASVVLVAREALDRESNLTRRMPWLVASVFGLVHGLGFAGALGEIGLPEGPKLAALVGFNLGVEIGQLAVVAVLALLAVAGGRALASQVWIPRAASHAIGALGAWWLLTRTFEMIRAAW